MDFLKHLNTHLYLTVGMSVHMFKLRPPNVEIISPETTQTRLDTLYLAGGVSTRFVPHTEFPVISCDVHLLTSTFQRLTIRQSFPSVRDVQIVDTVVDTPGDYLGTVLGHVRRQLVIDKLGPEVLTAGVVEVAAEDYFGDYKACLA